jgi:hypothetical protein
MARENPIIQQIKERRWQWIGQTLIKGPQAIERQVLNGAPRYDVREEDLRGQGERKEKKLEKWGRPRRS